jgi:hypothetical protein
VAVAEAAVDIERAARERVGVVVAVLRASGFAEQFEGVGFAEAVTQVAVDIERAARERVGVVVAVLHQSDVGEAPEQLAARRRRTVGWELREQALQSDSLTADIIAVA